MNGYYYGGYPPIYSNVNGVVPDTLGQYKTPYLMPQQMLRSQAPMPQMPTQTTADIIVVLNENEATSYFVAPNNTVTLWDKNLPTIYIKSVDGNGVPSMRILDYTERAINTTKSSQEHVCQCSGKFVSVDDFNALREEFNALAATICEIKTKAKKAEVLEDE